MAAPSQTVGDHLLLTPREPLLAGGAAEAFEMQLRTLIKSGKRDLVIDLSGVTSIDSAGVRALVRGHTSAQRAGGRMSLAAARPAVAKVLEVSHLSRIFDIHETVEKARFAAWPWKQIWVGVAGTALCLSLLWIGLKWPNELAGITDGGPSFPPTDTGGTVAPVQSMHYARPFIELGKLIASALIGLLVSAIHQPNPRERASGRAMEQAQTLLCVSGAMMMIIVGNSLVRAFGVAGAASIIRFRTPVDDPKDVTILFLLMALGMSAGLGALAVAGVGTAFLCVMLVALAQVSQKSELVMKVEIVAAGREFPTAHVESVFARNGVTFEPREITQSDDVTIKYHTFLAPDMSIEELTAQLMVEGSGVSGVSWDRAKR